MLPELAREELQICAHLYSDSPQARVITLEILERHTRELTTTDWIKMGNPIRESYPFLVATWWGHNLYVASPEAIENLCNSCILDYHVEKGVPIWTMEHRPVFNEFYRELDIQIALGSI